MSYQTITLSSAGISTAANLNWIGGKPTTAVVVPGTSTSSATFTIQFTMDDPQRIAAASALWFGISSNTYSVEAGGGTTYAASSVYPDGIYLPFGTPIAGLRINATSLGAGSLVMKVLQGEGW